MFNFVSDFAPLIQLIVGSIFLNDYYAIKRWPKIEKEKREKIKTKTPDDFVKQYVTRLRYQEGMTQVEISEELNLSQSEISKRLFKLMQKIRKYLNE